MVPCPDPGLAETVAQELAGAGVLQYYECEGRLVPYTLTSGLQSPCYPDHRVLLMHPTERRSVIAGLARLVQTNEAEFDCIVGVETAGIPFGVLLAETLGKPFCFVRKTRKTHGRGRWVECVDPTTDQLGRVLVFDEVFSTGGTMIRAVEVIRNELLARVELAVAITSNELFPSADNFSRHSIRPLVITNLSYIAKAAYHLGLLSSIQALDIIAFLRDPVGWTQRADRSTAR